MVSIDFFVIPALIFCARIVDVTIGTMKLILISKGMKKTAAFLGFFEVLIWLLAISKIFENLNNPVNYVAYAGGFATGTYMGMLIEERIALGMTAVQIITRKNPDKMVEYLKNQNYEVTRMRGQGYKGTVHIIHSILKRNKLPNFIYITQQFHPQAFYTINDIRYVSEYDGPPEPKMMEKIERSLNLYKRMGLDGMKKTGDTIKTSKPYVFGKIDDSLKKFQKTK